MYKYYCDMELENVEENTILDMRDVQNSISF
jgi:hypothetical protein